ncbi:acrosin-binding protein isoform X1 [Engystomops pustulosus]|uniref:acrosin-binding protein isoform X1 n=1 Tax=Engystomops pustulosus TaxID=76066 RepID=UPI003AFA51B1
MNSVSVCSTVLVIFWWTQVFLSCSTADTTLVRPGTPLSVEEYEKFIKMIQPEWKAKQLCEIRLRSGCEDPQVFGYDLVENHGHVPAGPVCTDSDTFDSFCQLAMFRCMENQFYVKRIPCSETITKNPNADELSEEMINPLGSQHAPASRVTWRPRALDEKDVRELLSSHLRSLTVKLLEFSFAVCNQTPIRRTMRTLPKSPGAPGGPATTSAPLKVTEEEQNDLHQDLDEMTSGRELLNLTPDKEEELSLTPDKEVELSGHQNGGEGSQRSVASGPGGSGDTSGEDVRNQNDCYKTDE